MNNEDDQLTEVWGLVANGSSGLWDVSVDESLDRSEWSLEIEGPQTYLAFQLQDLKVIPEALRFLRAGPRKGNKAKRTLGLFGSSYVSLRWDNEGVPRCFLVVGPKGRSTLRLSLEAEDIRMLIEALRQVVEDLPHVSGE